MKKNEQMSVEAAFGPSVSWDDEEDTADFGAGYAVESYGRSRRANMRRHPHHTEDSMAGPHHMAKVGGIAESAGLAAAGMVAGGPLGAFVGAVAGAFIGNGKKAEETTEAAHNAAQKSLDTIIKEIEVLQKQLADKPDEADKIEPAISALKHAKTEAEIEVRKLKEASSESHEAVHLADVLQHDSPHATLETVEEETHELVEKTAEANDDVHEAQAHGQAVAAIMEAVQHTPTLPAVAAAIADVEDDQTRLNALLAQAASATEIADKQADHVHDEVDNRIDHDAKTAAVSQQADTNAISETIDAKLGYLSDKLKVRKDKLADLKSGNSNNVEEIQALNATIEHLQHEYDALLAQKEAEDKANALILAQKDEELSRLTRTTADLQHEVNTRTEELEEQAGVSRTQAEILQKTVERLDALLKF